ncbi:MAG: hypothetical protein GF399_06005 [Candidatus Coatesbacteria bacterium]|nr:hypothetical protein [Candidatus Coatesbacteria bacterium]
MKRVLLLLLCLVTVAAAQPEAGTQTEAMSESTEVGYAFAEGAAEGMGRVGDFGSGVLAWVTLALALALLVISVIAMIKLRHGMYYFFSFAGLAGFANHLLNLLGVGGYILGTVLEWLIYLPLAIGLLLALRDRMLKHFLRDR